MFSYLTLGMLGSLISLSGSYLFLRNREAKRLSQLIAVPSIPEAKTFETIIVLEHGRDMPSIMSSADFARLSETIKPLHLRPIYHPDPATNIETLIGYVASVEVTNGKDIKANLDKK